MEEKYGHCWKCGSKRVVGVKAPRGPVEVQAVPKFASYEDLANVPKQQPFIFRLFLQPNPLRRPLIVLVMFGLLKFFGSPLIGKYGLYVVIVGGILGLIFILWGHFRRDPSEGVGVKLN